MVITTLKKFCWIVILLPADRYHQSENNPEQSGCYRHCVDENIERRNHYLDLAGIENYTSKFGPGNLVIYIASFWSLLSSVKCSWILKLWFVCSNLLEEIGLYVCCKVITGEGGITMEWLMYCKCAFFEVLVCVAKLGGQPSRTIFTSELVNLVYRWGEDWILDSGCHCPDDSSIYCRMFFVLITDQKIRECGFIPGILPSVPHIKGIWIFFPFSVLCQLLTIPLTVILLNFK